MRISPTLLGMFIVGFALFAVAAPAQSGAAADDAGQVCELHLWGAGRPHFVPKSNFLVKVRIDPAQRDTSNPLSNASLYSTVNRVAELPDQDLAKLFPNVASVKVIRHSEIIDIDQSPLKDLHGRLAPSEATCYGDLILAQFYEIIPNPDAAYERAGVIGALLVGHDRLNAQFWFRDLSKNLKKPAVIRNTDDTPIRHVPPNSIEKLQAMRDSMAEGARKFVAYVNSKRPAGERSP